MTREDLVDKAFANETHRAFFKSVDATVVTTHRLPLSPRQGTQKNKKRKGQKQTPGDRDNDKQKPPKTHLAVNCRSKRSYQRIHRLCPCQRNKALHRMQPPLRNDLQSAFNAVAHPWWGQGLGVDQFGGRGGDCLWICCCCCSYCWWRAWSAFAASVYFSFCWCGCSLPSLLLWGGSAASAHACAGAAGAAAAAVSLLLFGSRGWLLLLFVNLHRTTHGCWLA